MKLTKAEEQVMQVIWQQKKIFIRDIISHLPDPKPAYNTVGTFLKILEQKGFVTREKYGNIFQYSPKISKGKYTTSLMKDFLTNYFDGSLEHMLSHFLNNKDLDLETFEELSKKLKENKK
ncbi:BlaI/MecI/CopY family transcriptional regulator [Ekhidna sp.]